MRTASDRALVTGATGYIGRHLVERLLQNGRCVRVFVRSPGKVPTSWKGRVEIVVGDITGPAACVEATVGVHTVFHLAAAVHSLRSLDDDSAQMPTFEGTRQLLEASLAAGVSRFVFMSSVAVYGIAPDIRSEKSPYAPVTAYGRAKARAESLFAAIPAGRMTWTILQPATVYGPNAPGNLQTMMRTFARRRLPALPSSKARRSLISIDDLAIATLGLAADGRAVQQVFIVADDAPMSLREIQEAIASGMNRPMPSWEISADALRIAATTLGVVLSAGGWKRGIVRTWMDGILSPAEFSAMKIKKEAGFTPQHTFRDDVSAIIASYGV